MTGIKVLLIDDDSSLLEISKEFLELDRKIFTDIANSAEEALVSIKGNEYDVVVSDFDMPDKNGIQLLKELRRDGCKVPFILFTGKGREEVVIEALNNGADFYLQKGGQPSSQFAELSHMIWISHSRRQAVESTMRSSRRTDVYNRIANVFLTSDLDDPGLLKRTMRIILEFTDSPEGGLSQFEDDGSLSFTRAYRHDRSEDGKERSCSAPDPGIKDLRRKAMAEKMGMWDNTPRYDPNGLLLYRNILIVPLFQGDLVIGHLEVSDREGGYSASLRGELEHISQYLAPLIVTTSNRKRVEKARAKAAADLVENDQKIVALNRILTVLSNTNQMIVRAKSLDEILSSLCTIAIRDGQFEHAWVGMVEEGGISMAYSESAPGKGPLPRVPAVTHLEDSALTVNSTFTLSSFSKGPNFQGCGGATCPSGSVMVLPIRSNGVPRAVLGIHSSRENFFNDREKAILEEMVMDVSFSWDMLLEEEARMKAEKELRQSEERFRVALFNSPVNVSSQDLELRYTWIYNPQLGYSPSEVIGKSDFDVLPQEAALPVIELKRRAIVDAVRVRDEISMTTPEGKRLFYDFAVEPLLDQGGRVIGVTNVVTDITERKNAEELIRLGDERFYKAFANNPIAMSIMRLSDGEWVDVNESFARLVGYDRKDLVGHNSVDLNLILDPEKRDRIIQELSENGEVRNVDVMATTRDGKRLTLLVSVVLVTINGQGHAISMQLDVTERKQAEEELRVSENRYRSLFSSIQSPISIYKYVYDESGEIIHWTLQDVNSNGLKLLGKTSLDEVRGMNETELFGPRNRDVRLPLVRRLKATGEGVVSETYFDWLRRYYISSLFPMGDDCFVNSTTDITDLKQAQRKTEEYAVKLERSNAELEQFAYVASHDLQEPLRMVTACLDRLQKKYPDQLDWRAKQYMDFAIEGGLRAREVLAGLLEYSHVESPADPLGPIDMESALRKAVDNLAFHVSKENVTVTHDPLPSVVAEDQRMVQVFQLLIDNALKFHGPERPRVHISSQEGPNDWTFSVSDNGIGIDPAYKDKIFVLFQRLNPRESYDGNGIGLSICRKIVEGQGGTIWFDSTVGKGTTFYFTVPKEKGTQG